MTYKDRLIFMWAVDSLKICTLMGSFCPKHTKFEMKKYKRVMSHDTKKCYKKMFEPKKDRRVMFHNTGEWCKLWGGTDWWFEKWHEELSELWPNIWTSQNFHFNGFFLTKVCNVWAKKLQRSYLSRRWKVMQYLKESWLMVWKMT